MTAKRLLALVLSICMTLTVATFPVMAEEPTAEHTHHEEITLEEVQPEDPSEDMHYEAQTPDESAEVIESDGTINGLVYVINNSKVTITDYTGSATSLTIPSTIEGYPVTAIGYEAFDNCSSLTSVTIPDSVTSIGNYAFEYCSSLTSITIPDSVTSIGSDAFAWCYSLTSVTIGDSVTSIGGYAFYSCDSLTSVTIGNSVTSIGSFAFYSCDFTSITIPDSVTSIGSNAFEYCGSLTSVTIGDSVTSIGSQAFYYCDSLKSVTIGDSVTSIGGGAFQYCSSLTSITIPDSVTSLGNSAFYGCSSLTMATIGSGVKTIGSSTFYNCKVLANVAIPESVTGIYGSAFEYCYALAEVYYGGTEAQKQQITISSNNSYLTDATWYYNCCDGKEGHTYDNACDTDCNVCGETRTTTHTYDNACDTDCNVCGATRTINHTYDNDCDASCNVCGATRTITHTYDNACDTSCNVCGATRAVGAHVYDNACDVSCNECGVTRDVPDHVYTNACDVDCNECGKTRRAPHVYENACDIICALCGATRTTPLDTKIEGLNASNVTFSPTTQRYSNDAATLFDEDTARTDGNGLQWNWFSQTIVKKIEITLNEATDFSVLKFYWGNNDWNALPAQRYNLYLAGEDGVYGDAVYSYTDSATGQNGKSRDDIVVLDEVATDIKKIMIEITDHYASGDLAVREIEIYKRDYIPLEAEEHVYDTVCDYECNVCGEYRELTVSGVTASKDSAGAEFAPEMAIDKDESTPYKTASTFSKGDGVKSLVDIVFDFGRPVNLTEMYTQWGTCRLTNGVVYGANSADATEWVQLGTITDPTYTAKDYGSGFTQTISHDGYYRYIKLSVTKISAGGRIALYEASFNGDADVHVYTNDADYTCNVCGYERLTATPASNFKYTIYNNNRVTITGYYGAPSSLVIPAEINGYPVTAIGSSAFYGCSTLRSVIIPDSVTHIYSYAFYNCSSLTRVVIPDSVTSIGSYAFRDCDSLASVVIPDSVTSIGDWAFGYCDSLTSITIPDSVTHIYSYAFAYCDSLTSVTIPDSVTSIGNWAFADCDSLTSVVIPDSVTHIYSYAFAFCDSLANITIGNSMTSIGDYAFYYCDGLTSVTIPSNVVTIGNSAFGNTSITTIAIPASVKELNPTAFNNCRALTEINVDADNELYTSVDGVLYNKQKTVLVRYPLAKAGEYTIPDTVVEISTPAFLGCTALTKINVSEASQSYSSIDGVLYNKDKTELLLCPAGMMLTQITIPDTVTTIASGAFYDCTSLTSITIPASVTRIKSEAFGYIWYNRLNVYYYGTAEQRENIVVEEGNDRLFNQSIWYSGNCEDNGHTYDNGCDVECNVCGAIRTANNHVYDNNCDPSCNECGHTRIVSNHFYDNRCDADCNVCGAPQEVGEHFYTDDKDVSCNECGYMRVVPTAPTFTVENKTATAGDTFTVAVSTKNNVGIVSLKLRVGYDEEVLELVSIEEKDFANTTFGELTKNPISMIWEDVLSPDNTTNGTIALLTFKVKDTASAGTTEITVTYDPEDVYDYDFNNVEFAVENGTVTVVDYYSGDVNGDGAVNNKDLGILRRYLNEWSVDIVLPASDVNGDGAVNNKDMGILRRYLNNWDVVLK